MSSLCLWNECFGPLYVESRRAHTHTHKHTLTHIHAQRNKKWNCLAEIRDKMRITAILEKKGLLFSVDDDGALLLQSTDITTGYFFHF